MQKWDMQLRTNCVWFQWDVMDTSALSYTQLYINSSVLQAYSSMHKTLHVSLPQPLSIGHTSTNTTQQLPSQGELQIPLQKVWWGQLLHSPSGLMWPQYSQRASLQAKNTEKHVFPSWAVSEAAHHSCTINIKLRKIPEECWGSQSVIMQRP